MKTKHVFVATFIACLSSGCERSAPGEAVESGPPPGAYAIVDLSGGPDAASYPVDFSAELPADATEQDYKTRKLVLKWIEPGQFKMGGARLAKPIHPVTMTRGFYLAIYEVTQAQWENVMGPTTFQFEDNPAQPAESISWEEIRGTTASHDWPRESSVDGASFMGKLSAKSGGKLRFDLPTESQWEFACRAGTSSEWSFDDAEADPEDFLWSEDNSDGTTQEVGTLKPNPWGLYDMHGNVAEWCLDRHGFYSHEAQTDPVGPTDGWNRVWRGGAWDVAYYLTRSAVRSGGLPAGRYPHVGVRPAALPVN